MNHETSEVLFGNRQWSCENSDALALAGSLPEGLIHCCVTSPPYFGLRDYGVSGQMGLENTPEKYVAGMVELFREVRRALRDDATFWLNIGDTYASGGRQTRDPGQSKHHRSFRGEENATTSFRPLDGEGVKPKDLIGIPWMLAFALRADGWYLRSDCIWHKPNPMPESVTDRPTKAHEYVFLLTKSASYFYDAEAVAEPATSTAGGASFGKQGQDATGTGAQSRTYDRPEYETRNKRSVWTINTKPYKGAHFATMPMELAETCVRAGCPTGGVVYEPFVGSGTTLAAAVSTGRRAIGSELNPAYVELCKTRMATGNPPLFG